METHEDKQFLETVVRSLVDNPDAVQVERTVDEMGVLLTLDVHGDDMGKIIGRSGNTAKAIRTLLRVVGMKHDARVNLKINEPESGTPSSGDGMGTTGDDTLPETSAPTEAADNIDQAIDDLKI
jgi:predicted RNA-binding protein YlqC (UPF0109 family)